VGSILSSIESGNLTTIIVVAYCWSKGTFASSINKHHYYYYLMDINKQLVDYNEASRILEA
jgi:hypothetical protein